ncbi:MAG: hypothetical protein LUH45_00695 [Clostridiales bacterium]|nr:hypothetical protein [Clostridiales bacterium]
MYGRKIKLQTILCVLLSAVFACALGWMLYTEYRQEAAFSAASQALKEEASSYVTQRQALLSELDELESSAACFSDEARFMVGFLVSDVSDLSYIREKAETHDFSPVLVLDCTMAEADLKQLLAAAEDQWEVMLYASPFSAETNGAVLTTLSCLDSIGKEQTGVFFLRDEDNNDDNVQLLLEDGFLGYTSYSDVPTAGQTDDGTVYFDYSFLSVSGTTVESRLAALYQSRAFMLIVFDMASIDAGTLTEDYVTSLFATLQTYTQQEDCSFSTVAAAVAELSTANAAQAEAQAEYQEQAAELQAQLARLDEGIDEIFSRLQD